MWVYVRSEPGLWTVGFHSPDGGWNTDTDHGSQEAAARRVAYLNGNLAAEAPQPRVLWRTSTRQWFAAFAAEEGTSFIGSGIQLDVPPGTRVVVIEDTEEAGDG